MSQHINPTPKQTDIVALNSNSMTFRSRNIISVYTDAWLKTAENGLYMVLGGDASGSFLAGVENSYGTLEVCIAAESGATNDEYGVIRFCDAKNNEYYRGFYRKKSTNELSWRGSLAKIVDFTRLITTTSSNDAKTVFVQWLNDNKNSLPINHGSIIAFRTSNYPNYDVAYGVICCMTANYGKMKIVSYYDGIDGEYVLNAGEWSAK